MQPFVKWAGGKRRLFEYINEFIEKAKELNKNPKRRYYEPFLGGGAVFFMLKPKRATISDINEDLINAYKVIQSNEYERLIELLHIHAEKYRNYEDGPENYYYMIREWDREENRKEKYDNVERAARLIFLNKTCYNGLYRVNSHGQFNTPVGRYKNPKICDEVNIREIHKYLSDKTNDIKILHSDYELSLKDTVFGDVVYADPPYDYEDDDGFTKYQMHGFTFDDFKKLKKACDEVLVRQGAVIISNNVTKKVSELMSDDRRYTLYYEENRYHTLRSINCNGLYRKTGYEVIYFGLSRIIPFPQANNINTIVKLLILSKYGFNGDTSEIEKKLKLKPRQISYYISALNYLQFTDFSKNLTDKALKLNQNKQLIEESILVTLKNDSFFSACIKDCKKIESSKERKEIIIKRMNSDLNLNLAKNTMERRAGTVLKWIKWYFSNSNIN